MVWLCVLLAVSCTQPRRASRAPSDQLAATISIIDEPNAADGKNICVLELKRGGALVQSFGDGALITCNGISMVYNNLAPGFAARIPAQPTGGGYAFVLTRGGVVTPLTVPAVERPQLTGPLPGARVPRRRDLTVSYVPGGGDHVVVAASDGLDAHRSNGQRPDDGSYQNLDVTGLRAGPGTIRLTRTITSTPRSDAFTSTKVVYRIAAMIDVVWE